MSWDELRAPLAEMAPLLRRVVSLDPNALSRIRTAPGRVTVLVRPPFGVLAARTVATPQARSAQQGRAPDLDRTCGAADLLGWLDGERAEPPEIRDGDWRGTAPPVTGWQRVDTVPDDVIRGLVRSGALALKEAAEREGVAGARPRAEFADALLDSMVLTASSDSGPRAEIALRTLSALTRLGFLARDSRAAIDIAGRWTRVAGAYGSVFAERQSSGLGTVRPV